MTMKFLSLRLSTLALIIAGLMLGFTSCTKDDDDDDEAVVVVPETTFDEVLLYDEDGILVEKIVAIKDYGKGTGSVTLTSDKTYVLDGFVFVNDGQVLTIQPGTIIKGKSGQGENASALIVARGGQIDAQGTAIAPIVFTAESDGIRYNHVDAAIEHVNNIPATARGLWGGVILLGKASSNNTTTDKAVEGIPTTEPRGLYGGNDDTDNSGTMTYVSIRHGGTDIGEGNEINGLTFCCVGSGTTISHIEVIGNKDDGYEWFGSTLNCTYLVSAFNGDDSFDYDQSFRGRGQFWFVIQDANAGDRIAEQDGGPSDNEFGQPYAIPQIANVTFIGRGASAGKRTLTFRDNAGGKYYNSIFVNQKKGVDIEYLDGSDCSFKQWQDGNLELKNNIFFDIADGTANGIFKLLGDTPTGTQEADFQADFATSNNEVGDPGLTYILSTSGGLNPVPANAIATQNIFTLPAGFTTVNYKGAFDPAGTNWAHGWTLLHHDGYLD